MKKSVNLVLLLLLIVSIVSVVGLTYYYQVKFRKLTLDYLDKTEELMNVASELRVSQSQLNETLTQFTIKVRREQDLSSQYQDVSEEKEHVEEQFIETSRSLEDTSRKLKSRTDELNIITIEHNKCKSDRSDLQTHNTIMSEKLDTIERLADQLAGAANEVNSQLDSAAGSDNIDACKADVADADDELGDVYNYLNDIKDEAD